MVPGSGAGVNTSANLVTCLPKVAPIGDAEYGDGRNRNAFRHHPGAPARGRCLPEDCPREKQRLAGVSKAHSDELGEEDAQAQIQLGVWTRSEPWGRAGTGGGSYGRSRV
jgi:hypothetical protein